MIFGALAKRYPPHSRGKSGHDEQYRDGQEGEDGWDYYETLGGGAGASAPSMQPCVQAHMTNTLNTPAEVVEMNYPLRIERYQRREGSGGEGATAVVTV